jgi:hypothetical protein
MDAARILETFKHVFYVRGRHTSEKCNFYGAWNVPKFITYTKIMDLSLRKETVQAKSNIYIKLPFQAWLRNNMKGEWNNL